MRLDINTSESIKLTAKLEKLHRSALPSAMRNTLNQTAFNAKKLVPKKADDNFTIRQKNLFNRMTIVNKASGFNVNNMVSRVGIDGSKGSLSDGLEKQETGGNLKSRKLIAHRLARVSGSDSKKLKKKNYFSNIKNIGTPRKRIKGSKFFRIKKGSKETVFERTVINKITPIFSVRQSPVSNLKSQPFIKPSAIEASKQMPNEYKKQAEFQIRKYLK